MTWITMPGPNAGAREAFVRIDPSLQRTVSSISTVVSSTTTGGGSSINTGFQDLFDGADSTAITAHLSDIPSTATWGLGNETLVSGTAMFELDTRNTVQGLHVRFTGNYFSPTIHRSSASIDYAAGQDVSMGLNLQGSSDGTYYGGVQWAVRFCRNAVDPDTEFLVLAAQAGSQGTANVTMFVQVDNSLSDSGFAYADDVVMPLGTTRIGLTLGASLNTATLWRTEAAAPTSKITISALTTATPGSLASFLNNHTIAIDYPGSYSGIPTTELQLALVDILVAPSVATASSVVTSVSTTTFSVVSALAPADFVDFEWRVRQYPAFYLSADSPVLIRTPLITEP